MSNDCTFSQNKIRSQCWNYDCCLDFRPLCISSTFNFYHQYSKLHEYIYIYNVCVYVCTYICMYLCTYICIHVVHPYSSIDVTAAWKRLRFILSVRSDFQCCVQSSTSPGSSTPQDTNCTATCPLSRKLFKLDEPDMQDTAGEAEMNS